MADIDKKISKLGKGISWEEEKAKPTVASREGMVQRPLEIRDLSSTRKFRRKCAFKNCQSVDHYTRKCSNLKPGNIQEDILQVVIDANLCLRCLRDPSFENHEKECVGGYMRQNDQKWVQTDCITCFATLPSGEAINLNKRICFHILDKVKRKNWKKRYSSSVTNTPKIKQIKEWKEEGGMGEEVAPSLGSVRTTNQTIIKSETEWRGASLVEDHQIEEKGRNINQLSEKNITPRSQSEKGINTPPYNKMELTSPEPLDWASEPVGEEGQPTKRSGEGTN